MVEADATQSGLMRGARQELFEIGDGQVRLPGFNEVADAADGLRALPEQRQVSPKAGEKFDAAVAVNEGEAGNFLHVGQAFAKNGKGLVAGEDFHLMAEPLQRLGDGEDARRMPLPFAAATVENARHVLLF